MQVDGWMVSDRVGGYRLIKERWDLESGKITR